MGSLTQTPRCRIAVVQLASLASYATAVTVWSKEPAPPSDEQLTPYLSKIQTRPGVQALMSLLAEAHLGDLLRKLRAVLAACADLRVNLLIFPEYSLPPQALPLLRRAATEGGYTIVAGSHSVTTDQETLQAYGNCGLVEIQRNPDAFARKAIAPVFYPDGSNALRFKAVLSKWETDLRLHEGPQEPIDLELQGIPVKVQILVCIEALHISILREDVELLVVPASTPQVGPFENLFSQLLLHEVPSVIANSATYGGSQFALRGPTVPGDFCDLLKLSPPEEALLVTDVELRAQVQKRQSARVHPSSQLLARRPFLYASVAEHAALIEFQLKTRRQGAPRPKSNVVRELASATALPVLMRQQLEMLATALEQGSATQQDLVLLLDSLPLPDECHSGIAATNV